MIYAWIAIGGALGSVARFWCSGAAGGHVGFGQPSHIHTTKILRLAQDLPVVVEIVDWQEKIDAFLPVLDTIMASGLVTIEKVRVLQYGPNSIASVARVRGGTS